MTREQALKRAQRLWGKRAAVRANERMSSPEKRAEAQAEAASLREQKARLESEIVRREQEAGIPELREQIKAVTTELRQNVLGRATYHKFEAGYIDNVIGAFHIRASGDTWEETFTKAEAEAR